ncbi:MAG: XRE family transcriptional regulator [Proteobacteria bacterium]|uniref:helix-turn-helix domain-containing protein n=1 Tax=Rudaea sp. TaxID=2136325 RepID=UPI0037839017|nr:XRE family transcriptional regulator [Pseudomonadota bacterium]
MAKRKNSIGSNFDDFLADDGMLAEATATAIKRVIAWQIDEAMKAEHITKKELAERMGTSRSQLDRLLDESDAGLTLETLSKAAHALGRQVRVELVEA